MYNHPQRPSLIAVIGLMACFYGNSSERKENDRGSNPLTREDSRWTIDVNAQRKYIINSKNYKKSSRAPKTPKPIPAQDLDDRRHVKFLNTEVRPHLRSCSCCEPPVPIEGVPDKPWYLRCWALCCTREK